MQTAVKLRNLKIYENVQLIYSLNYSNFFQDFVYIFEKPIIRNIFPRYMDPGTSAGWEKMSLRNASSFF